MEETVTSFLTAVMAAGGTWFLYGWSVLRKMWVYGAAGFGIAILGTVLLHMMRGKVRVCFLENMEEPV